MKMSIFALTILIIASIAQPAFAASCQRSDLYGTWIAKYRYSNPQQIGICQFIVQPSGYSGECLNLTYGILGQFFDGSISIRNNCKLTARFINSDASITTVSGMLKPSSNYASGTVQNKNRGRVYKGTFTMTKQ